MLLFSLFCLCFSSDLIGTVKFYISESRKGKGKILMFKNSKHKPFDTV